MWFERFTFHLLHLGFTASVVDSSLFIFHSHGTIIYLLLYVDDIIVTGNNSTQISHLIATLSLVFELKDLGPLNYFLGIQITYILSLGFLSLNQSMHQISCIVFTWRTLNQPKHPAAPLLD